MSDWPKYEKRRVSFNNGDVPTRTITIILTPLINEDEAIRNWVYRNGMGLIWSWKNLGEPTTEKDDE